MKLAIAFLASCTIFSLHSTIVNQATFHTPDGTQVVLLGEEHAPVTPRDASQLNSLTRSIQEWAQLEKKPIRVILEEPSEYHKTSLLETAQDMKKWHPSGNHVFQKRRYLPPSVVISLKSRIQQLQKNTKKIKAENAEMRSASGAARAALIKARDEDYPLSKFDAKKVFNPRKLSVWSDPDTMLLSDIHRELEDSLKAVEQRTTADKTSIQKLQLQLDDFKQKYQSLFSRPFQDVVQRMNRDQQEILYRDIEVISDKVFEQYLLARVLQKSGKSNVVLVAGRDHIGLLRGLLQREACSLASFKKYEAPDNGAIKMDQSRASRLRTLYLKLVRFYLQGKRKLAFHAKQLSLRFKKR